MKVSLVIATYNGERFIGKQLDSIINQSRTFDEVIVSDDGSSDKTCDIVKGFIEKNNLENWKFRLNDGIHGFIGNFLSAIQETTGDIIFLCDQDDDWEKNKVEVMTDIMMRNPEIKSLNSAVHLIDSQGGDFEIEIKRNHCNANFASFKCAENKMVKVDIYKVIFENVSPGCTMCFDKSIKEMLLGKAEYLSKINFPHDWYINSLAALNDGMYFYNRELTRYRIHGNNTIGIREEDMKREETPNWKFRKNAEHRLGVARRIKTLYNCFYVSTEKYFGNKKRIVDKISYIVDGRLKFCETYSLFEWIKLLRHLKTYYKMAGGKTIIGDLIFALKLDSFFMKK